MRKYRVARVLCLLLVALPTRVAFSQSPTYVVVKLPKNVSIELPRNWTVLSNDQRITLDASIVARQEMAAIADFRHDLGFAANYYDDSSTTAAMVNVRYYPGQTVTQAESRTLSADDLLEADATFKTELTKGVEASGSELVEWIGTSRREIRGTDALVSEYRRRSVNGVFRVRLVRVLDASQSFTLTVSFREDQALLLEPIAEYIVGSLKR